MKFVLKFNFVRSISSMECLRHYTGNYNTQARKDGLNIIQNSLIAKSLKVISRCTWAAHEPRMRQSANGMSNGEMSKTSTVAVTFK